MTNATQRQQGAAKIEPLRWLGSGHLTDIRHGYRKIYSTLAEKVVAWCDWQLLFL